MKIIFHENYKKVYAADPAAARGRLDQARAELASVYPLLEPEPATDQDILLVHSRRHLERIKSKGQLYDMALLAAGGAVRAARTACSKEPSFGLIRPPGHHASVDSCWGFCWFNNMAVAMEKMRREQQVAKGVIIDIDLHFGDGTSNFYRGDPDIVYYHLDSAPELETVLDSVKECQLLGISAGFDRHVQDWGGMLTTDDYRKLGQTLGDFSRRVCPGRVFAILEGGYNHGILGQCIQALCQGLDA